MTFLLELEQNTTVKVYAKDDKKCYKEEFIVLSQIYVNDFFVDCNCKVYILSNNNIYICDTQCVLLAANVINYEFTNTEKGCLVFYIQKNTFDGKPYFLVEKRVESEILQDKVLCFLDHCNYKILKISQQVILLYYKNVILTAENGNVTKKEMPFEIMNVKHMNEIIVMLDTSYNIQIYNLSTKEMMMSFKALGKTYDFEVFEPGKLIAVMTNEFIFVIHIETKSIYTKVELVNVKSESLKMFFVDQNTMMLYGNEIFEYKIDRNAISNVKESKPDTRYKVTDNLKLENRRVSKKDERCNCHNTILSMKIEMRRGLFELNEKIRQLEKALEKTKK